MSEHEQILTAQQIADAVEALGPLARFRRGLDWIEPVVRVAQGLASYEERVQREGAALEQKRPVAERDAADIVAGATAEAARIVGEARVEAERILGGATLVQGNTDRLTGEVAELEARKTSLADEVRQLVGAKAALQPTKA